MALFKKKETIAAPEATEVLQTADTVLEDDFGFDQAAVDEVMKKYDRESNTRIWEGWQKWAVYAVMAAFSLFAIYVTLFATWLDLIRYPSFLGCIMIIGYLNFPAKKGMQRVNHIPWYDWIIMIVSAAALFYIVIHGQDLTMRATNYTKLTGFEIVGGLLIVLAVAELCRRSVGIPILCVAAVFVIYALYYNACIRDKGLLEAVKWLSHGLSYSVKGIFTTPIQVCSKFIVIFIIFGAFLERTGVADFFIQFANRIAGAASGGPAKVAVIASALEGMVSGSSVANTVGSGSVTIPMMKRMGYKPEFAGAVEAAASTGGQIMPPVMGAAAFLMADYVGVPYSNIIVRAIFPAILYFLGIFICVHLEAKKMGLKGLSRDMLPKWSFLLRKIYLLIPLVLLVYLVSSGTRTMAFAAAVSIIAAIVVGLINKDAPMNFRVLLEALANGAKGCIAVAAACAIAGIIAGCIAMSGLASQIITAVVALSGGSQFIAMFLTMICCIILGMGVPTTANYCIMASTCAPILIQLGVPTVAAHFFVFYFGIVADITPPVALAAYAGSAIAGSHPMKTALNATKLAIAAFVVPYIFAMNPVMLLVDVTAVELVQVIVTSVVGMIALGAALEGYLKGELHWALRILAAVAGLGLLIPGTVSDIIGVVLLVLIFVFQFIRDRKNLPAAA